MALTKAKASNILLTTPAASSNDTTPATTQYVTTAINNLIDGAPATLNTLDEIAAALNDDAALNTTLTNSIAAKLPLAGGTMTGDLTMGSNQIIFDNNSQAILIKDAAGTASYVLYQDNADTLVVGHSTNVEKIRFDTGGNEGALVIDTNGNVGIKRTPNVRLEVAGDSATGGILIKQGAQVAYTPSSLANFRQGITFENTGSGHAYGIGYGQGGKIKFSYHDNASTYTELASIGGTSGDLSITSGSLILSSGEGINFSATSNASTAGTSMGSELLDDYEEGTWAPTIIAGTTNPSGGSNLASNGHYVKVGRQVWVSYYAGVSWTNSPSGGVYVNRLPFPIANNNNNNSHPSATTYNFGTGTGESPFLSLQLNQTNARLYMMGPAGWGAADFASHVSSPLYITGQFTYFTT